MTVWKVSVQYILFINTIIIGKCATHLWSAQSYISFGDKFHRDHKWLVHGHPTMKRYHLNLSVLIPSPLVFIPLPSAFGLSAKGMQRMNKKETSVGTKPGGLPGRDESWEFWRKGQGKAFQRRSVWWTHQPRCWGVIGLAGCLNCEDLWDTRYDRQRRARSDYRHSDSQVVEWDGNLSLWATGSHS